MLGVAEAVAAILLQGGLEAVLAAVRLVGDYHDVVAIVEDGMTGLLLQQGELLHRGEDDAAGLPLGQQATQFIAVIGLDGLLLQQLPGGAEGGEQLAVKVVAVGHHDQGGVVHLRLLEQLAGIAAHGDALAGTLGVPHHPDLLAAGRDPVGIGGAAFGHLALIGLTGGDHGGTHRLPHGMELVVAGDLLDQGVGVALEEDEVAQVVEQQFAIEETAHQGFQLPLQQRLVVLVPEGAPGHEALLVGRQRADPGVVAIADDHRLIGDEQLGNLVLVGLDLVEGVPDIDVLGAWALELQHRQRQAVDETHDIGAAQLAAALQGELVDGAKVVGRELGEIHQQRPVMDDLVVALVLHGHTVQQQAVKGAIADHHVEAFRLAHHRQRLLDGIIGQVRVKPPNRRLQIANQQHLAVVGPFRREGSRRDIRPVGDLPATLGEPLKAEPFQLILGHTLSPLPGRAPRAE